MLVYAIVETNSFPEFLSAGFIGLATSFQPTRSRERDYFPDVCVTQHLSLGDGYIGLELNWLGDNLSGTDLFTLVKGPIPISQISKVIFNSSDEKDMFYATYAGFPDLPLEMFDLVVNQASEFSLNSVGTKIKKPSRNRNVIKYNASQYAAMIVGIKLAFSIGGNQFNNFPRISLKNPSISCFGNSFVTAILRASGFFDSTPKISYEFLELYLSAADRTGISLDANPKNITSELAQQVANRPQGELSNHVKNILGRVEKVRMGLSDHPQLLDTTSNSLDRAIYLACSVSSLDAFDYIKKNLRVGPVVQSLAAYLVATRLTLDQIQKEFWREDQSAFKSILDAAADALKSRRISLDTSKRYMLDDFSTITTVDLNGFEIVNVHAIPNHQVMLVVSILQSCGYNPTPVEDNKIKILSGTNLESESFEILLEHRIGPLIEHQQNVVITVSIKDGGVLFNTKRNRSKIFRISEENMVAIYVCPTTGALLVTRSQLTDTMDKDELECHIELVKAAASAIKLLSY